MKVFVFLGLLACLSSASAAVIPLDSKFNSTVEQIKEILAEIDPARVTDVSVTLLDRVTATLKSASVSDFSKFVFPSLVDDGENINAVFQLPKLSANVDSLLLSISTGLSAGVPTLDASVGGVNVDVSASYTTSPLRVTALSVLLQLQSVSIQARVELNQFGADISVEGDEVVETINNLLVEAQSTVSQVILSIANKVLSIIDRA
ncbi:uncharacterized protein LOC108740102 [Agrilus planipennis]|uniref:Uncharacterized protein LOC108740102 n=1 Tax=Agrilus planipennis TaxID=224129 RepID=A0A1W4X0Z1_AGRPL|nr:uncharacterized protein LOC108740102 [Agrilus planipennis]